MRSRLGDNVSLARGPRLPLVPSLNAQPFTGPQKAAIDARAKLLASTAPYVNPDLSFFNPPADNSPFTVTPTAGAVPYPMVGAGPITVLSYTVSVGLFSVIRALSIVHIGGNQPDFTGIVIWRLLKNGAGIRGMNALNAQYGTFAAPKAVVITGQENDLFAVTVECPALLPDGSVNQGMPLGAGTAASFDGWTYPIAQSV